MSLPAQLHRMVQNGIPWWQIMYTGIMSTDAVLMIEVSQFSSTLSLTHMLWIYGPCSLVDQPCEQQHCPSSLSENPDPKTRQRF